MELNRNQQEVIFYSGHCVVLACPGGGKTSIIERKIEHIIKTRTDPSILNLSFTRASSQNGSKRIISILGKESFRRIVSGTFHSVALLQLKNAGIKNTIIHGNQVKQYVQRAMEVCNLNMDIDMAVAHVEKCRSNLNYKSTDDNMGLGQLYYQYVNLLKQNHSLDFSGILLTAVKLMQSGKLSPLPCTHLLCDEAQDMDSVQYAWCLEYIESGAIITAVGDDDQSIYKFRNAQGLDGMMRLHYELGAKIITLDTNYRCRTEILTAAGNVILNNSNRIQKNLIAARGAGGIVQVSKFQGAVEEANAVVRQLMETCSNNPNPTPEKYSVAIQDGECAFLARNNHNLAVLAAAFVANGIPHNFKEQNLWSEEPVCFVLGLLQSLITNERGGFDAAMFFSGINQNVLEKSSKHFRNDYELFMNCATEKHFAEFDKEIAEKLLRFTKIVQIWGMDLYKKRDPHVIRHVFDWFVAELKSKATREGKNYQKEIKLLLVARDILIDMSGPLSKRLQRVLIKFKDDKKNTNSGAYLGTLHSSKGLEFKNVWLLQMDDGVIPDIKILNKEVEEEERRLFYVGMTRAENSLFISYTQNPSKFVLEAQGLLSPTRI